MKNKISLLSLVFVAMSHIVGAQAPMPHASPEVRQRARDRADYNTFRRKIGELKEFAEEKKKIPLIKKETKEVVKVYATIDSVDTDDDTTKLKTLTGYITQQVGDNIANAYQITFDRTTKRITSVKRTGDAVEPEGAEAKEKPAAKKPEATKATPKKKKTGDEDEDDDTDKDEKEEKEPKEKDE